MDKSGGLFYTAVLAVLLLVGALHHFALMLFSLSWIYVILALILSLIHIISGRRLKSLEDFEPEDEIENHKYAKSLLNFSLWLRAQVAK